MLKIAKNKIRELFWMFHCKGYVSFNLFKKLFYKDKAKTSRFKNQLTL